MENEVKLTKLAKCAGCGAKSAQVFWAAVGGFECP
jgi:hypothetical protein